MQTSGNAVQSAYNYWASSYDTDRNRTRDLDAQTIRALLKGQHFHRVIEAGCGTGKNTVWLAGQCNELLAFDFSEGMLAQAQQKVRANHVQFQQVDLTKMWICADAWVDQIGRAHV